MVLALASLPTKAQVYIDGDVYGGGEAADVGEFDGSWEPKTDASYSTHVVINQGVMGSVYGGGNAGSVIGSTQVDVLGGWIGYEYDDEHNIVPVSTEVGASKTLDGVFGAGFGIGTTITKTTTVNIGAASGMIEPVHIYGSVYGGGEEGQVGGGYVRLSLATGDAVPSDSYKLDIATGKMTPASESIAAADTRYYTLLHPATYGVNYNDATRVSQVRVQSDGSHGVDVAAALFGGGRGFYTAWDVPGYKNGASISSPEVQLRGTVYGNSYVEVGTANQDTSWINIGSQDFYTNIIDAEAFGLITGNDFSSGAVFWEQNYFVWDVENGRYLETTPGKAYNSVKVQTRTDGIKDYNLSSSNLEPDVMYYLNTGRVSIVGGGEQGALKGNYGNKIASTFDGEFDASGVGGNSYVIVHSGTVGDVVYHDQLIDDEIVSVGEVNGCVFGGGLNAIVEGRASVVFDSPSAWCRGNVFAGGCMAPTYGYKRASENDTIFATQTFFYEGWGRNVRGGSNLVRQGKGCNNHLVVGRDSYKTSETDWDKTLVTESCYGGSGFSPTMGESYVEIYSGKVGHVRAGYDLNTTGDAVTAEHYLIADNQRQAPQPVEQNTVVTNHQENLLYEGAVYGAGFGPMADVLRSHVTVYGGKIRNGVYGGGEMSAIIDYDAMMAGTAEGVYPFRHIQSDGTTASEDIHYPIERYNPEDPDEQHFLATDVRILGGKMSIVCGGGRGYSDFLKVSSHTPGAVIGNTNVYIAGGTIDTVTYFPTLGAGCVFGGGLEGEVVGHTNVTVVGGTIRGKVFAGGRGYRNAIEGEYYAAEDDIYQRASNNAGRVFGNTSVHVKDSSSEIKPVIEMGVYGGGSGFNYQAGKNVYTVAVVEGNSNVLIEGGTIGMGYSHANEQNRGSYAGGHFAPVMGYGDIVVKGSANVAAVYGGNDISGKVYGYGRTATRTHYTDYPTANAHNTIGRDSTTTYVRIEGTPLVGHVFGGGNGNYTYYDDPFYAYMLAAKPVQPATYVDINLDNTTLVDNVPTAGYVGQAFGGGNAATVDSAKVYIYGLGLCDTVFGGGNSATVNRDAVVTAYCNSERTGSNTGNYENINYLFGGNNRAEMKILPDIFMVEGIFGKIYGGGNAGKMSGDEMRTDIFGNTVDDLSTYILVNSTEVTVTGAIFGGCNQAPVAQGTFIDVRKTTIAAEGSRTAFGIQAVYGGNDISDNVNCSRIDINGGYIHNAFGGGNGYYKYFYVPANDRYNVMPYSASTYDPATAVGILTSGRPYVDSTNVYLYGGTLAANLYGGGYAGDCGVTNVVVNDTIHGTTGEAVLNGKIFGGGSGIMDYVLDPSLNDGKHVGNVIRTANTNLYHITTLDDAYAYGGGNAGDVENAYITVHPDWNKNLLALYGGCYGSDVTGTTHVLMNCEAVEAGRYNVQYLFGGNDYTGNCHNSIVNINGGRYLDVFGAGNGDVALFGPTPTTYRPTTTDPAPTAPAPNSEDLTVNFYDGIVEHNLYGGGKLGTCFKGDTTLMPFPNASDYSHIVLNIHGGTFQNNIFAGALGEQGGKQLVYGLKQVNMDNGTVARSVYGGSENVNDGYPRECVETDNTTLRPSTVINYAGGVVGYRLYGGGYLGVIFGSTYLNVGVEAIDSSVVWSKSYNGTANAYKDFRPTIVKNAVADTANNLMARIINVPNSIYNGSDWGEAKGTYIFNVRGYVGGESRMLIDGHQYSTSLRSEGTSLPQMNIDGSIMGSGTSTEGGDVLSHIEIRYYGDYVCPQIAKQIASIQRADSVVIDSVCLQLTGTQDGYTAYPSPSYSLCRIDNMVFRDANVFRLDAPAVYLGKITFLDRKNRVAGRDTTGSAIANNSRAVYDWMTNAAINPYEPYYGRIFYDTTTTEHVGDYMGPYAQARVAMGIENDKRREAGLDPFTHDQELVFLNNYVDSMQHVIAAGVDICARVDNVSPYTKLIIGNGVYVDVRPFSESVGAPYGPIEGYAYLVAEPGTQAFVSARNKVIEGSDTSHYYDGGFFSTCTNENVQDMGMSPRIGTASDIPTDIVGEYSYTNYGTAYRTWVTGDGARLSSRNIAIVAHSDVYYQDDASHTTELPASNQRLYRVVETGNLYYNPTTHQFASAAGDGFLRVDTTGLTHYAVATASLQLPPASSGHYYKVSQVSVDESNGGEMRLIPSAWNIATHYWDSLSGTHISDFVPSLRLDPNLTFGLRFSTSSAFATSANATYNIGNCGCPTKSTTGGEWPSSDVCKSGTVVAGNEYLATLGGFHTNSVYDDGEHSNVFPSFDFALTYCTDFNTTIMREVKMVVEEYDQNGHLVAPINLIVSVATVIKHYNNYHESAFAMYNAGIMDEYVRKVVLPASLAVREIYLQKVKWEPTTAGTGYFQLSDTSHVKEITGEDRYKTFGISLNLTEDISNVLSSDAAWGTLQPEAKNSDLYTLTGNTAGTVDDAFEKNFVSGEKPHGLFLGTHDGRYAAGIELALHYNGEEVYPLNDVVGTLTLTLGYTEGADEGEVEIVLDVKTRQYGDTIYLASATSITRNGITIHPYNYDPESQSIIPGQPVDGETGKTPNKYVQTLLMATDKQIYHEGDVICVLDALVLGEGVGSANENFVLRGSDYNIIQMIRYSGSHYQFPGKECAYRGPMFVLKQSASLGLFNMRIDGSGISHYIRPHNAAPDNEGRSGDDKIAFTAIGSNYYWDYQKDSDYKHQRDTLWASAPMFLVYDDATLNLNNKVSLLNNFNLRTSPDLTQNFSMGGAVAAIGDATHTPTVTLSNNVNIYNNIVKFVDDAHDIHSGGALHLENASLVMGASIEESAVKATNNYYYVDGTTVKHNAETTAIDPQWYVDSSAMEGLIAGGDMKRTNVFLTRTAATTGDELHDGISDAVAFSKEIAENTRIGISKWFPGEDVRDTIQIANVTVANQLLAQSAVNNNNFFSDTAGVNVFYHSTISPYRIFFQRCASFKKQDYITGANVLYTYTPVGGDPVTIYQRPVLDYLINPDASCPNGTDTMTFSVHGGFYPYQFTWSKLSEGTPTEQIRSAKSLYTNDLVIKDNTYRLAMISNTDSLSSSFMSISTLTPKADYALRASAVDLAGCSVYKDIDVHVDKVDSKFMHYDNTTHKVVYTATNEGGYLELPNLYKHVVADSLLTDTAQGKTAKVTRAFKGVIVDKMVRSDASWGTVAGYLDEAPDVNVFGTGDKAMLCEGDVLHLVATGNDHRFVMWNFDPYDNPTSQYVVPNYNTTVIGYFGPSNYWKDVVTTQPGTFTIDYNGDVHIHNEDDLAWLISVVNGLHGEQIRTFRFNKVIIHPKEGGYNMADYLWTPLGSYQHRFRGKIELADVTDATLDKYAINSITVNEPNMEYAGFFACLDSAHIDSLSLTHALVHGSQYVGALAGYSRGSHIDKVRVTDSTLDGGRLITILTSNYASGGMLGKSEGDTVTNSTSWAQYMGNAVYNGGLVGYAENIVVKNNDASIEPRMTSVYSGGLIGYSTGNRGPVRDSLPGDNPNDPSSPSGSMAKGYTGGSYIANNYVRFLNHGRAERSGGIVGYASNTAMENNYVYGETKGTTQTGGVGAMLGNGVVVDNCYYERGSNDAAYGFSMPMNLIGDVTTFSGSGNQVRMASSVDGTDNLTRSLNLWVRNHPDEGFATWRSDLTNANGGYPVFGTPDMIPVFDTMRHETCDHYTWYGEDYFESGSYTHSVSDPVEMVDSTITLVLTIHSSMSVQEFDSVRVGEGYEGYGFSVSAAETELLRETVEREGVAVLMLSDTMQTVNGCDSIMLLNLTVYKSDDSVSTHEPLAVDVKIYPNPTLHHVNVEADGLQSVEVFDNVSRRIRYMEGDSERLRIDLDDCASGAYYLRVRTTHGVVIKKVIKR